MQSVTRATLIIGLVFLAALRTSAGPTQDRITILYDAFGKTSGMKKDWGYSALVVRLTTVRPWPTAAEKVYLEQGQADENGRYRATTPVVIDRILADSPDLKHSGYVDYPAQSGNVTVVVH